MEFNEVNTARIQEALENAHWTFAKTMPNNPHEWVFNKHGILSEDITMPEVADYIQAYGFEEYYYSKLFMCMNLGDHKYWTCDYPTSKTDLINRCKKGLTYQ